MHQIKAHTFTLRQTFGTFFITTLNPEDQFLAREMVGIVNGCFNQKKLWFDLTNLSFIFKSMYIGLLTYFTDFLNVWNKLD